MSVESDLKKEQINVVSKLDIVQVVSISNNITELIYKNFKQYNIDKEEIFKRLSTLQMYFASMPEGMSEASYFYKNSSIYFNNNIDKNNLEEFAIHECLHRVQEIKTTSNKLVRMGLYNFSKNKHFGLAINEAAVQLMTTKILNLSPEFEKYFGVGFNAVSPSYYPLICQLLSQLCFLVGDDLLVDSSINSHDLFKEEIYSKFSKSFYVSFVKALDNLLDKEEDIVFINNTLLKNLEQKKVEYYMSKIETLKQSIQDIFLSTQNLVLSTYFDTEFKNILSLDDLAAYEKKLNDIKIHLGSADGYSFYKDFVTLRNSEIAHKKNMLENGNIETAPVVQTTFKNKLSAFLQKLNFLKKTNLTDTKKA